MKKNKGSVDVVTVIMVVFMVAVIVAALVIFFRPQSVSKSLGGTTTVTLDPGLKLEEITWKDNDLWYLTRPMRADEHAETHTFQQSSNLGILQGTVIIIEQNRNKE